MTGRYHLRRDLKISSEMCTSDTWGVTPQPGRPNRDRILNHVAYLVEDIQCSLARGLISLV